MGKKKEDSRIGWKVSDIVTIGVLTATLEAAKIGLAFLPNVELVTLLLVVYTTVFGKKALAASFAFVGVECMVWGMGLWVINYLYIWPFLVLLALVVCKSGCRSVWGYSILCGSYGLGFGALCAIPYFFIGGPSMMLTWWIAGIPYDLIHGISNFILCLILYRPFRYAVEKCRIVVIKE